MKTTKKELQKKLDKLQKEIDNFKEETFKNGWYIHKNAEHLEWMMYYDFSKSIGYGFVTSGEWINNFENDDYIQRNCFMQNNQKVEQALIKEAKKRGFKKGVKFNCALKVNGNFSGSFDYIPIKNILECASGCGHIFNNGNWAEIIEDNKPTINGYEMEDLGKEVKFGCKSFSKKLIIPFYENAKKLQVDSLNIDGHNVSMEKLKEVVDYLNK